MYVVDLVLAGILGAVFVSVGLWYWLIRPMGRLLSFEKEPKLPDSQQERDAGAGG